MLNVRPEPAVGGRSIGRWRESTADASVIFVWPRPAADPALLPADRRKAALAEDLEDLLDQVWRCERQAGSSTLSV
jgi:hypothetical protein